MMYTDDPIADFDRYDLEQSRRLARLPVCEACDQPVQDDRYFLINGETLCRDCMEREYMRWTEDCIYD